MTSFVVIDDDKAVRSFLIRIIEEYNLGEVWAEADNGVTGEEAVIKYQPDIVIIDLLLPQRDGIAIIKKARALEIKSVFIMLSQVTDKEIVANAYKQGIEFFISKPINIIEVVNVTKKVQENLGMKRTFQAIESTVQAMGRKEVRSQKGDRDQVKTRLNQILVDIGILGDLGSKDIQNICMMIQADQRLYESLEETPLNDILKMIHNKYVADTNNFTSDPKAIEMRLRRSVHKAMRNLAAMGLEDYSNEKFCLYGPSLFDYSDLKTEMDFIRGKNQSCGKVNIKSFIKRLLVMIE